MSFALDVSKFANGATAKVDRIKRAVVLKLFGSVIQDTPVLTGRLRGNWQTSIAAPRVGELPLRGEQEAMTEISLAASEMRGNDLPVFLRNNLPYARRIEFDGWSHTKAPAGMVRKNVARITRLVNEAVREGKL
jgi:hypothetical protein